MSLNIIMPVVFAEYFALVHNAHFVFTDHIGRINSTTPVLNLEYKNTSKNKTSVNKKM